MIAKRILCGAVVFATLAISAAAIATPTSTVTTMVSHPDSQPMSLRSGKAAQFAYGSTQGVYGPYSTCASVRDVYNPYTDGQHTN